VSSLLKTSQLSEVHVLEVDPELGAAIPREEFAEAVKASRAPVRAAPVGEFKFDPLPDLSALGALILEGMVVVRIEFGGAAHLEVLGEEDVVSPWYLEDAPTLAEHVSVYVVRSGYVALLDREFALRMARWPEVSAALVRRLVVRTRRMILRASILSRPRVHERVELMLWLLADQFGSVTPEGLLVRLSIHAHPARGDSRRQALDRHSRDQAPGCRGSASHSGKERVAAAQPPTDSPEVAFPRR
jgi:hypothetical protein